MSQQSAARCTRERHLTKRRPFDPFDVIERGQFLVQIGVIGIQQAEHTFILQFGDEILSVDGAPFHPILSFRGKKGETVRVTIKTASRPRPQTLAVLVHLFDGQLFEQALFDSCRVIEKEGLRIAYVHMWSYAGPQYQQALVMQLWSRDLSDCDSLVLDLRDGWGGASLEYLYFFRPPAVTMQVQFRGQEEPQEVLQNWGRPVVLLVNGGSRSGKEMFAYGFKKLGLGKVIGERTGGAVLGGRPYLLSNGDVLYLAVQDVLLDGQRLEGVGVEPDMKVLRDITVQTGKDEQLEAAVEVLVNKHRED